MQASGIDTADTLAYDDGYAAPMSPTLAMPNNSEHGGEGATADPKRPFLGAKTLSLGSAWEDSDEERARQEVLEDETAGTDEDNVEGKTDDKGNG